MKVCTCGSREDVLVGGICLAVGIIIGLIVGLTA